MEEHEIQRLGQVLASKTHHYLITTMGMTLDEASDEEFFRAFSLALREEIMINWTATIHTLAKSTPRTLYYLCMEYLPGRLLQNNVCNIQAVGLVQVALKALGRTYSQVAEIEHEPALGNGGLGRLASCLLDSLSTQRYPAMGYGLRYQYGVFEQELWNGMQVERPEMWLRHKNPWEFPRDTHPVSVFYAGRPVPRQNANGVEVYDLLGPEEVRALSYDIPIVGYSPGGDFSVLSLRLWTTKESPRNFELQRYNAGLLDQAAENTTLTDVLYPNDNNDMGKRIRLKQEYLLAAASVTDIVHHFHKHTCDMDQFADKVRIQINDTHPALVIAELMHILLRDHNFAWGEAFEVVRTCCGYTNHTVLKEALEEWNEARMAYLLPCQYRIIQRLNADLCSSVRAQFPSDEERVRRMSIIEKDQIKMAHLSLYGSSHVNGVSRLHTEILCKEIFKDFYQMEPAKFVSITNGVTHRRWLHLCNPALSALITDCIGSSWLTDFKQIAQLSRFASDESIQKRFLEIKRENKRRFARFLLDHNPVRDAGGAVVGRSECLGEEALFDVQIKRIHEYKRQLMNVLHVIMLYHELLDNPMSRSVLRMVLIGGKAAPGYVMAKQIIRLIFCVGRTLARDHRVREKLQLVYYENYNASRAEAIIPAADLSEQISCAGTEASGTGNMKLSINGALTIGTEDGASIEMHEAITGEFWPFGFGASAAENAKRRQERAYNPWDVCGLHPAIARAVAALKDRSFAESEEEHETFLSLYRSLLEPQGGSLADYYFVLSDLPSYYQTQKKVEALYLEPKRWAQVALENIARMGPFSSDQAVHDYARLVWGIQPLPLDHQELTRVRQQYLEYDRCRVF